MVPPPRSRWIAGRTMKWRFRITTWQLMVLVAILAVASLVGRTLWERSLQRNYRNPVSTSQLSVGVVGTGHKTEYVLGNPVPVIIVYDFSFNVLKMNRGSTAVVPGAVWFEDTKTGLYVDGYTFDAPLTVGGRERASGKFVWEALVPRPGRYLLHSNLYHVTPSGEPILFSGNGTGYSFIEAKPMPAESGAKP